MLVLTRRVDESLMIGDSITVTVLSIEGDKVKLGIKAPREITILRHEIYQAVQEQNKLEKRLVEGPEPDSFKDLRELLAQQTEGEAETTDNTQVIHDSTDEDKPAQK
jgi:carbon storage regulator